MRREGPQLLELYFSPSLVSHNRKLVKSNVDVYIVDTFHNLLINREAFSLSFSLSIYLVVKLKTEKKMLKHFKNFAAFGLEIFLLLLTFFSLSRTIWSLSRRFFFLSFFLTLFFMQFLLNKITSYQSLFLLIFMLCHLSI